MSSSTPNLNHPKNESYLQKKRVVQYLHSKLNLKSSFLCPKEIPSGHVVVNALQFRAIFNNGASSGRLILRRA